MTDLAGVVFDLDGTLLDTLADLADCVNRCLAAEGYPQHDRDTIRGHIGSGVDSLARNLLPAGVGDDVVARCVAGFAADYRENWNVSTRVYDGLPELLDECTRAGLRMAVLSNKPHAFTKQCVDGFLDRWAWDPVFGDRAEVPRKPDPAGAIEVAEAWQSPPERIAFVGDSEVDAATARNAGMPFIGVTWGFRSRAELAATGADTIVEHPSELRTALLGAVLL